MILQFLSHRQEDKVYTDKLTIEVNHEPIVGSESASAESSGNFDPDTLERNLERDRRPTHTTISNKTGEVLTTLLIL